MSYGYNPFIDNLDLLSTGGGPGGAGTITGNDGGPISQSGNNWNLVTANSTPEFVGSGSTLTLDFGISNLVLGSAATAITSADNNVGLGQFVFASLTSGDQNTFVGWGTGSLLTTGSRNTVVGYNAASIMTTGSLNTIIGDSALAGFNAVFGSGSNVAIGLGAGVGLTSGLSNIFIGTSCAGNYTGAESSNIIIGNAGVLGESNKIRIGTPGSLAGQQNAAYIAGITGVTAAGAPVAVASDGQLSSLGFGTSGQVLTSTGAGTSPTWQTPAGGTVTSVSGTANRITSTGGATPVIDISASYVGQSSITTLGTIATGIWNGTAIGPTFGGTGITTYTTGDILYSSASNVLSKLGIGTAGQVLTVAGGIPSWAASGVPALPLTVGNGGTGNTIFPVGSIPIGEGTAAFNSLSPGAAGTIVRSNGAGVDPAYSNATFPAGAATGDLLYGISTNNWSQLTVGSTGQVLTVTAGAPGWSTLAPESLSWTDVTGTSQSMAINSGYLANNASLVTLTLPSTAAQFSVIKVTGIGAGGWKIAQNANQKIRWLGVDSTVGVSGILSSVDANACVTLRAYVGGSSTFWLVEQANGNITLT